MAIGKKITLYASLSSVNMGVHLMVKREHRVEVESLYGSTTAPAGSDVVQSGRPIFDDFFQHLWSYIGNNTANVVFQMVKRLWLIRIDQLLYIAPQKKSSGVKSQDLGGQFTGPKREIRRSPNVSFNKSIGARAV
ncbi:hypothetical protein TNCV_3306941 [Trichonephila clavipes]|nr:hypothetical protein TNCV_3306941 [Trichonephila clavipes]